MGAVKSSRRPSAARRSSIRIELQRGGTTVTLVWPAAGVQDLHVFANRSSTRLKVLVHDGIGIWLAARRLNKARFIWHRVVVVVLSSP